MANNLHLEHSRYFVLAALQELNAPQTKNALVLHIAKKEGRSVHEVEKLYDDVDCELSTAVDRGMVTIESNTFILGNTGVDHLKQIDYDWDGSCEMDEIETIIIEDSDDEAEAAAASAAATVGKMPPKSKAKKKPGTRKYHRKVKPLVQTAAKRPYKRRVTKKV